MMTHQSSQFEYKFQNRLFFTPIYGFKLNLQEHDISEMIKEAQKIYANSGVYDQYKSTRDAFQSEDNIVNNAIFKQLLSTILNTFNEVVCKDYNIYSNNQEYLSIKKAWININPPGGYNVIHNHPNSFYSGVYYLQTSKNSGEITFTNPVLAQGLTTPLSLIEQNSIYTFDSYSYQALDDYLLLFPSYLQHYVHPNKSDSERICVSFNIGNHA